MAAPARAAVVTLPFPFSDLSASKLRPALVLASAGRREWIMCMVTSNPYGDSAAIELTGGDFTSGGLRLTSYVRPGKLFTASEQLIRREVGRLRSDRFDQIIDAVVKQFRP